jgi:thiamine-monophosphate kinase
VRPERAVSGQTVAELGEFELIRRITEGRGVPQGTVLGPGDDAAVLGAPDGRVVATTDVLVQNVHFRLDWSTPEQVGRKAVAVNIADLAAMGAVPTGLLAGIACPADTEVTVLEELCNGMWSEAARADTGLVGGDVVTAETLMISITALGSLGGRTQVTRAGARVGDVVAASGKLGWAAAGLAVLGRGFRSPITVVGAHRCPEPPYQAGPQAAAAGATAMIDTSDGLIADLGHIAAASGVGIDLRIERLEAHQRLVDVGSALGVDPLHWVLTGGEDHALVATFAGPKDVPEGWRTIGAVVAGHGVTVNGEPYPGGSGWEHFR